MNNLENDGFKGDIRWNFEKTNLYRGWMPPHTSLYIKMLIVVFYLHVGAPNGSVHYSIAIDLLGHRMPLKFGFLHETFVMFESVFMISLTTYFMRKRLVF